MANNQHKYGFRPVRGRYSSVIPSLIWKTVATGQNDTDDAAVSCALRIGDPVKLVSTGGVTLCKTTDSCYGIIGAIGPYWNGTRMVFGNYLPNQTAWGTVEDRRSMVGVWPASSCYWEIDVDENTTATTKAGYVAFLGENCTHVVPGDASTGTNFADPRLDISLHATTASLVWRIEEISDSAENKDFSGTNVKLIVTCNKTQEAQQAATTIAGV